MVKNLCVIYLCKKNLKEHSQTEGIPVQFNDVDSCLDSRELLSKEDTSDVTFKENVVFMLKEKCLDCLCIESYETKVSAVGNNAVNE